MVDNERSEFDLKRIVGKHLSGAEVQAIKLVIEKSKVKRERALLIINKGVMLYFSFLFLAVLGLTYEFIDQKTLNTLILMGFGVLIVAGVPYIQLMKKSEQDIDMMMDYLFK